ncbi:MAG TPA: hypothetical protein PKD08_04865 [Gudongella oleilytica]|nr:hypothetical protein [Gudongella oleilytica]
MTPPELTLNEDFTITFVDDQDWRESITGISYYSISPDGLEGMYFEENIYNIFPGEIEMIEGVEPIQVIGPESFPDGWDSRGLPIEIFVVYADGYEDALAFEQVD